MSFKRVVRLISGRGSPIDMAARCVLFLQVAIMCLLLIFSSYFPVAGAFGQCLWLTFRQLPGSDQPDQIQILGTCAAVLQGVSGVAGVVVASVGLLIAYYTVRVAMTSTQNAASAAQASLEGSRVALEFNAFTNIMSRLDGINATLVATPELWRTFIPPDERTDQQITASFVADMILSLLEQVYAGMRDNLIDEKYFEGWVVSISSLMKTEYMQNYWIVRRDRQTEDFRNFIDQFIPLDVKMRFPKYERPAHIHNLHFGQRREHGAGST